MKLFRPNRILVAFILLLSLLFSTKSIAQGLEVGDNCPDVEIKKIINHSANSARISDFKGKAILIDFWFSSCTACIESMPKLDSIRQEFGEEIQILLVNHESEEKVRNTFKKIKRLNGIKLASVVSDTLLSLIFPHRSAPHEIWIDKNGTIMAITDHLSVTRENISDLISGKEMILPIKKDDMEYKADAPIITSTKTEYLLKYSCITGYQPGLSGSIGMNVKPGSNILVARAKNVCLQELYVLAYGQWAKDFNFSRVIIDFEDSARYKQKTSNSHLFCYDNWWKDTSQFRAMKEMQWQLDNFFRIESKLEKRKTTCLVLRKTNFIRSQRSEGKHKRAETYIKGDTLIIENVRLKYLIENKLNYGLYAWSPFQFIDETMINEGATFTLPAVFKSVDQTNQYLKTYGLEVVLEERILPVIVLRDIHTL